MSENKIHNLRLWNGEQIEIRETSDGRFYCPVCGFLLSGSEPPYSPPVTKEGVAVGDYAGPSFNICPCCDTHFGNDDYVEAGSVLKRWSELRIDWLNRVDWTSDALKQLRDNLDIDTDKLKRLAGR
jgi:hypothetical protein